MAQKSILEQALLQVNTLEEAVKANAKGILASTMKEELNSLLKEQEDENPDEDEKDVAAPAVDDEPSDTEEPEMGDEPEVGGEPEGGEELPAEDDAELPAMDNELEPEDSEEDFLDMTGASDEEVLKVFKAMKPEDGIVVKKDGNTVQFSDDGNDYIIKLDDESEAPEAVEGGEELPDELEEQSEPAEADELVYEIELGEDEVDEGVNSPFDEKGPEKGVKKLQADEGVTVTKSVKVKDGQPFDKKSPQQGVKKLQANEEQMFTGFEGTGVPGTKGPETKEPGRGGSKVTQAEKHDGTPPKGTKPAAKKEPGRGGENAEQAEDHPGTPPKGTKPADKKEPGKNQAVGQAPEAKKEVKEGECTECGDADVKEVEATEAARTKWNPHGNKGEAKRAGIPSKKIFKAGSGVDLNEQVETLKKQNDEYRQALVLFKDKLNEVAVFNANLAYATRLFTEHSTTKQEKLDILKRFDTISTITESKNLYAAIKTELETKKPISEAAVEKIASTPSSSSGEMLSESKAYESPQFKRMKELMNKIK